MDFTAADAAVVAKLAEDVAIVHAHNEAERAIIAGEWPFVCPYCSQVFMTADRWFPYDTAQCAINAQGDE